MICFVDLPNLRSIDSRECSFYHPRVVTLESITIHCIRIAFRYSKSPICRSTWFIRGSSIEINFEYCVDWFDFIHRCFFHSSWSCSYHNGYSCVTKASTVIYHMVIIESMLLYLISIYFYFFNFIPFHSMIIVYSLCFSLLVSLFHTPYRHSLVISIVSKYRFALFLLYNGDWISFLVPNFVYTVE